MDPSIFLPPQDLDALAVAHPPPVVSLLLQLFSLIPSQASVVLPSLTCPHSLERALIAKIYTVLCTSERASLNAYFLPLYSLSTSRSIKKI